MNQYLTAIEIGNKVTALMNHEGWKVVSKFLKDKQSEFISELLVEKDIDRIYFLQAGVQVINSLFNELDALVQNGIEAVRMQAKKNN